MPLTWRQTLAMLAAVAALFGASGSDAPASPLSRSPLVVTMSGTFQPFTEHDSHDLDTLTVTIADKQQWLFRVDRVDTATGTNPGVMLLSELFPPQLRILGATSDMAVLEQPTVAGKTVTLQGFLYIADRNFYVGDVRVAATPAQ
jgi:hypothetical protein